MNGNEYYNTKSLNSYIKRRLGVSLWILACICVGVFVYVIVCVVFSQGYEGVRESLNSKKNSALTVKSVDSNMNKKSKKKKEEEIELPSKKNQESSALDV